MRAITARFEDGEPKRNGSGPAGRAGRREGGRILFWNRLCLSKSALEKLCTWAKVARCHAYAWRTVETCLLAVSDRYVDPNPSDPTLFWRRDRNNMRPASRPAVEPRLPRSIGRFLYKADCPSNTSVGIPCQGNFGNSWGASRRLGDQRAKIPAAPTMTPNSFQNLPQSGAYSGTS